MIITFDVLKDSSIMHAVCTKTLVDLSIENSMHKPICYCETSDIARPMFDHVVKLLVIK